MDGLEVDVRRVGEDAAHAAVLRRAALEQHVAVHAPALPPRVLDLEVETTRERQNDATRFEEAEPDEKSARNADEIARRDRATS